MAGRPSRWHWYVLPLQAKSLNGLTGRKDSQCIQDTPESEVAHLARRVSALADDLRLAREVIQLQLTQQEQEVQQLRDWMDAMNKQLTDLQQENTALRANRSSRESLTALRTKDRSPRHSPTFHIDLTSDVGSTALPPRPQGYAQQTDRRNAVRKVDDPLSQALGFTRTRGYNCSQESQQDALWRTITAGAPHVVKRARDEL